MFALWLRRGVHSGGFGLFGGDRLVCPSGGSVPNVAQVPAQVVSSELGFRVDSDNNRFVDPDVTFRYDIDGKTYTGDRVSFGSGDAAWSQARVNAYPVGQVIDVRINPDDPTDAVIEPGGRGWERFLPLGGLVPLGVGVGIILSGRRRLRNPELMRVPSGPTQVGPKGHWIPATLGIIFTTVGVFIVRDGLTDIQIARPAALGPRLKEPWCCQKPIVNGTARTSATPTFPSWCTPTRSKVSRTPRTEYSRDRSSVRVERALRLCGWPSSIPKDRASPCRMTPINQAKPRWSRGKVLPLGGRWFLVASSP